MIFYFLLRWSVEVLKLLLLLLFGDLLRDLKWLEGYSMCFAGLLKSMEMVEEP
jgi:hypothetical protein